MYLEAALTRLRASGYPIRDQDVARLCAYVTPEPQRHGHYSFQPPELAAGRLRGADGPQDKAD